jgi:hypothetical protein
MATKTTKCGELKTKPPPTDNKTYFQTTLVARKQRSIYTGAQTWIPTILIRSTSNRSRKHGNSIFKGRVGSRRASWLGAPAWIPMIPMRFTSNEPVSSIFKEIVGKR